MDRPEVEPNLLYATAQQINPRRAGTPGRAPRTWRAVVVLRRPLRFFLALPCLLCALVQSAAAQARIAATPSVQLRLGALYATPLVKDQVSSITVDTAFPGTRSNGITVRQKLAPAVTIAARFPVKPKVQLEVSGTAAHSQITGDDGLTTWEAGGATVANIGFGIGYLYRSAALLHAGVGATRIFAAERGIFTKGNAIKPLFEAGVSSTIPLGQRTLDIDARLQSHSFGTATLRDNGGSDGSVLRAIVQIGTTLWQGRTP